MISEEQRMLLADAWRVGGRDRETWEREVRDPWVEILATVPVGWNVLANGWAMWTKTIHEHHGEAIETWESGANRVTMHVLLSMHDHFIVIEPESPAPSEEIDEGLWGRREGMWHRGDHGDGRVDQTMRVLDHRVLDEGDTVCMHCLMVAFDEAGIEPNDLDPTPAPPLSPPPWSEAYDQYGDGA